MSDEEDGIQEVNEWVEVPREEALIRVERLLTTDALAFELEHAEDETAVGAVATTTWFLMREQDDVPVLLVMTDPVNVDAPKRWFVHRDLIDTGTDSS